MKFTSVNGLGGGLELGATQVGLELVFRTGKLSLGAPVVRGNRPLLGWNWTDQFSEDHREWARTPVEVVLGNPPCAGFSTLTRGDLRGANAKVNVHIWDLVKYASLLRPAPYIVAFESVQQAFTTGNSMMKELRAYLEEHTGHKYTLTHLLQSNASLGGVSVRRRYFWVAHRIPFGVEYAQPARVARLGEAIRDLQGLALTFEKQPYQRPPTWWSITRRSETGVDGHMVPQKSAAFYEELFTDLQQSGYVWEPGTVTEHMLKGFWQQHGRLPGPYAAVQDKLLKKGLSMGINQTGRWSADKQGPVVTGAGPYNSVHFAEPRLLTYRECARIQGFPDTWRIWPARDYKHIGAVWGKGVPVDAGRWLGHWISAALRGEPGTVRGDTVGDREATVNITRAYKHTTEYERRWEHAKYVPFTHHDMGVYDCRDDLRECDAHVGV